MTSVSAGHIILTPTQPVGSGRPQRESNPGPPHQESRALPQSNRAPPPPPRSSENQVKFLIRIFSYSSRDLIDNLDIHTDGVLIVKSGFKGCISSKFKLARYFELKELPPFMRKFVHIRA